MVVRHEVPRTGRMALGTRTRRTDHMAGGRAVRRVTNQGAVGARVRMAVRAVVVMYR